MKKRKIIHPVEGIIDQVLREVIRDSAFSIQELAEMAKINRSSLQNFYAGHKSISSKSVSKILKSLPIESQEQFASQILVR